MWAQILYALLESPSTPGSDLLVVASQINRRCARLRRLWLLCFVPSVLPQAAVEAATGRCGGRSSSILLPLRPVARRTGSVNIYSHNMLILCVMYVCAYLCAHVSSRLHDYVHRSCIHCKHVLLIDHVYIANMYYM
jgi:hypothetical protein